MRKRHPLWAALCAALAATLPPVLVLRAAFIPAFLAAILFVLPANSAGAQSNPAFNIYLSIDYTSAEETLDLLRDGYVSTRRLSELRGNRIAASTTELISGNGNAPSLLALYLDSLQSHQIIRDDVFRLEDARRDADAIGALLDEMRRRNFNSRVVATVEQVFPQDIPVGAVIPVYVVALGHEHADAYVRRIVWKGDTPEFVGDGEGELTIIINLAAAVGYPVKPEARLSSILVTVAHEVFHAAFGLYKDASPFWKKYRSAHTSDLDYLLDLVQNEGIAYYLSMEQRMGDRLPQDWVPRMEESFRTFNRNAERLMSGNLTGKEIADILYSANLSGYWESYGSMVGMAMAREVDRSLGREALIESLSLGPLDLIGKYHTLSGLNSGLPKISGRLARAYGLK
ncbi:MAG TPA: DUF5700 domain-containing putative Zn-dependent protease [Bacteroidota bacterium]|nr:DUF5700 domain-containing putative Zn-dependent protease [Bacteroidota bacterium]